jgi:hypothetical protein
MRTRGCWFSRPRSSFVPERGIPIRNMGPSQSFNASGATGCESLVEIIVNRPINLLTDL